MAKRITKIMAVNAASAMAKMYLRDEIKKAAQELSTYATNVIYARVPKEVLETTKKYPDYIYGSFSSGFFAYSEGIRLSAVYTPIGCRVPSGCDMLEVDENTYKKMAALKNSIVKLDNKRAKFREETKNALYSLGTKDKIEKTFPNAIKYIDFGDDEKKPLPVSNYTNLQQIITKL